ncbi:MAG: TatD family hydrolase [Verrucomicrobiaceae bacterium]|nr:TatD family hydrolase [Verrucomicrobiaceae bacterium]
MLFDTHCHLANSRLNDDLPAVLERANAAGVQSILVPATTLEDALQVLAIHDAYPWVLPAVGIHPCDADSVQAESNDWLARLESVARRPSVSAIGEIGLDFFHPPPQGFTHEAWSTQQHLVVRAQLELAVAINLNVIIHTRNSHDEMLAVIKPFTGRLRAVFHCFSGTLDQAKALIDLGHLVSFTGNVTFPNAPIIQETAASLPDGTFMLETDAPFLAPLPHRGKRNEPAFVRHVAEKIAQLRGADLEQVAASTTATAKAFFKIPAPSALAQ